ncbi:MFS transporter [Nocardia terpenica]|uniref:MFS transporter n=1 Tax=Nocardia terpenica TaxID=455432 RepID=UPI0018934A04|nr:MFS transporter [Nocardia terpenica]MBF6059935.1 MFS transporter [Nocardia terpenica]MBF6102524.1 MFS transporter [Nocardia terpenica]MBF6111285.1 MFS transporter [Nocardia terpenica]MBF6117416.1 MFS transporter [Nocardia terpenica]MBF6150743.1 MFS transporter [Nocardia terpenica]
MANAYRELFSAPGSVAFSAAGFLARLPISMTGIGLITMLSQLRGQYALAGAVSAVFTFSMALFGPQVSRLVDRHGQGRVLVPAMGISVLAMGALLLCTRYGAPVWTLFVFAIPAGCMPNMAAMVRARWSQLYRDSPRLHTAFSLESVVDELTFVVGPALSVTVCTLVFPEAGPLIATVLLAVGVALFVAQRGTEPPVHAPTGDGGGSALRSGPLVFLVLVLVAGGTIVGTVDVVSVNFAEHQGNTAAAGIVVSIYAVGSALAGLAFGALKPNTPLPRLLLLFVTGTTATTVPLLVVGTIAGLSATVFVAGVFFAPGMIVIMSLVERIVPSDKLTEGMTWALTGLSMGVALGASVSGKAVDTFGPRGGFAVAVAAGAVALLVALLGYRPLTTYDTDRALPQQDTVIHR